MTERDDWLSDALRFKADVRGDRERFEQRWREAQARWPAIEAEGDRIRRGLPPTTAREDGPAFGDAPEDPLARLERKLDAVASGVGQLTSDVATLRADVSELKGDVSQLKVDVAQLKTDVTDLKDGQNRYVTKVEFEGLRSELRMVADGFTESRRRLDYVADLIVRYRVG